MLLQLRILLVTLLLLCISLVSNAQEDSNWATITPENAHDLELVETIDINDLVGTDDLMLFHSQLSVDGRYLGGYLFAGFSSRENDHFIVIDLYTQELIFDIETPNQGYPLGVDSYSLSTDAQWIVTTIPHEDATSTLNLYEVETETLANSWELDSYVVDIEFSPNNAYLGFSYSNILTLWSIEENELYAELELKLNSQNQEQAPAMAFSLDSSLMAFSTGSQFHLYELESMNEMFHLELELPPSIRVLNMLFLSDASKVLIADSYGLVYLVELSTQEIVVLGSRDMAYFSIQIANDNPRDFFGLRYSEGMSWTNLRTMENVASIEDIATVFDTSTNGGLTIVQTEAFSLASLALIGLPEGDTLTTIEFGEESVPLNNAYISPNSDYIAILFMTGEIDIYGIME